MACLISIGCVTSYGKNSNLTSFSESNSVFSITRDTPNAYLDATRPWITLTLSSDALSMSMSISVYVSVHCTYREQCIQRAFHSDLKPARQLSTCNQWAGIPYRRHFRRTYEAAFRGIPFMKHVGIKLFFFKTKIVLRYNCTLNFYVNRFRKRTLDLTMD